MTYQEMYTKFTTGQITVNQWVTFCQNYFNTVIMTDPDVVAVMKRLKNR